jgi:hypothetical protein
MDAALYAKLVSKIKDPILLSKLESESGLSGLRAHITVLHHYEEVMHIRESEIHKQINDLPPVVSINEPQALIINLQRRIQLQEALYAVGRPNDFNEYSRTIFHQIKTCAVPEARLWVNVQMAAERKDVMENLRTATMKLKNDFATFKSGKQQTQAQFAVTSMRCHFCDGPNHLIKDCRKKKWNKGCHICVATDHHTNDCPHKSATQAQQKDIRLRNLRNAKFPRGRRTGGHGKQRRINNTKEEHTEQSDNEDNNQGGICFTLQVEESEDYLNDFTKACSNLCKELNTHENNNMSKPPIDDRDLPQLMDDDSETDIPPCEDTNNLEDSEIPDLVDEEDESEYTNITPHNEACLTV